MAIPGFKPREPQRQMAIAVSEAIDASRPLVVEAGTGTGPFNSASLPVNLSALATVGRSRL
jgi:Rad3-related DNA helicase